MTAFNQLILDINRGIAESLPYQGTVVDLGCGDAPYREVIQSRATRYIAIDWPKSLHSNSHVDVFANLSVAIPLRSRCADTVVAFQVLEHLPEPVSFLQECRRLLRPAGRLFLVVPFQWHVHEAPHDYYRFTRYGLEYVLTRAGFSAISITETTGFWQTCAMKFNYFTREHFARRGRVILWTPVWRATQAVAPKLDHRWPKPGETSSYVATAIAAD